MILLGRAFFCANWLFGLYWRHSKKGIKKTMHTLSSNPKCVTDLEGMMRQRAPITSSLLQVAATQFRSHNSPWDFQVTQPDGCLVKLRLFVTVPPQEIWMLFPVNRQNRLTIQFDGCSELTVTEILEKLFPYFKALSW